MSGLNVQTLTGAVYVVQKVHLEGVSVVEDVTGVGRVILESQRLQGGVKLGFLWDNVDGRLSGPVSYREILSPRVRSYKYIIQIW